MDRKTALLLDIPAINAAIELIRSGKVRFSCTALTWALSDKAYDGSQVKGLYHYHYLMHTRAQHNGKPPAWWNANAAFPKERMESLASFRQACIKACSDTTRVKA